MCRGFERGVASCSQDVERGQHRSPRSACARQGWPPLRPDGARPCHGFRRLDSGQRTEAGGVAREGPEVRAAAGGDARVGDEAARRAEPGAWLSLLESVKKEERKCVT